MPQIDLSPKRAVSAPRSGQNAFQPHARNGKSDVDLLRKALAAYDQFARDIVAPFIIPLPLLLSNEDGPHGTPAP